MDERADSDIQVYYDGACPLCAREMRLLRRRDRRRRIGFVDIAAEGFEPAAAGVPREALMERIHARLPDGTLVEGVEVFRRLYTILGHGWLVACDPPPRRLAGPRPRLPALRPQPAPAHRAVPDAGSSERGARSSTSRTRTRRPSGVNGLARKSTPSSSTPWRLMVSRV